LIEFKSYDNAIAFYHSPEYEAAQKKRTGGLTADMVIIDGYDGPQPK
jgi:uncharacterized protein (DUF1330 family)